MRPPFEEVNIFRLVYRPPPSLVLPRRVYLQRAFLPGGQPRLSRATASIPISKRRSTLTRLTRISPSSPPLFPPKSWRPTKVLLKHPHSQCNQTRKDRLLRLLPLASVLHRSSSLPLEEPHRQSIQMQMTLRENWLNLNCY